MKKILFAVFAMTLLAINPVYAQHWNRGAPVQYHHGGWLAPFVGGAIIGGVVGGVLAAPPPVVYAPPPVVYAPPPVVYAPPVQPTNCWQELAFYDRFGRPVYHTVCQ